MPRRARKSPEEVSASRSTVGKASWEALKRRFNGDEELIRAYMSAISKKRASTAETGQMS